VLRFKRRTGRKSCSARPSRRHNRPKRDTCPFDEGDDPCVFCPKKNLMLAAIQLIKVSGVVFGISALSIGVGFLRASSHAEAHAPSSQPNTDPNWSELVASMDKMHMAMEAVEYSGNSDFDFVRLMLPHHQAAVDMAKTQLLHGKDPQMRRLAQEIITDQQLEIEVMQLWLKQHEPAQLKENQTTAPNTPKDN